ncbi:MAG TPA: hypothetical protein VFC87_00575, partial [Perlabentimonas sp.]|nr:hypothetical protein [Perlabentimonas sp.]
MRKLLTLTLAMLISVSWLGAQDYSAKKNMRRVDFSKEKEAAFSKEKEEYSKLSEKEEMALNATAEPHTVLYKTVKSNTKAVIFEEGFEEGNTHNTAIANWTQVDISGTGVWTANTSFTNYNRAPRTGSWNAFLQYGNTDWMFKEVVLETDKTYRLTFYARQDASTGANIQAYYGAEASVAGMTDEIIANTAVT